MKIQALLWAGALSIVTSLKYPILAMFMAISLIPIVAILVVRGLKGISDRVSSIPDMYEGQTNIGKSKPSTSKVYPSRPEEGRFRFYEMYDE